ncbi:mucin-4 [Indicator indicator]|uniref:mucin-4 n=1 Tax=Indicator indicator TaxID=1002788 RepID=UPI0023DF4595|nr:mucin-4 [Indicator indicator]
MSPMADSTNDELPLDLGMCQAFLTTVTTQLEPPSPTSRTTTSKGSRGSGSLVPQEVIPELNKATSPLSTAASISQDTVNPAKLPTASASPIAGLLKDTPYAATEGARVAAPLSADPSKASLAKVTFSSAVLGMGEATEPATRALSSVSHDASQDPPVPPAQSPAAFSLQLPAAAVLGTGETLPASHISASGASGDGLHGANAVTHSQATALAPGTSRVAMDVTSAEHVHTTSFPALGSTYAELVSIRRTGEAKTDGASQAAAAPTSPDVYGIMTEPAAHPSSLVSSASDSEIGMETAPLASGNTTTTAVGMSLVSLATPPPTDASDDPLLNGSAIGQAVGTASLEVDMEENPGTNAAGPGPRRVIGSTRSSPEPAPRGTNASETRPPTDLPLLAPRKSHSAPLVMASTSPALAMANPFPSTTTGKTPQPVTSLPPKNAAVEGDEGRSQEAGDGSTTQEVLGSAPVVNARVGAVTESPHSDDTALGTASPLSSPTTASFEAQPTAAAWDHSYSSADSTVDTEKGMGLDMGTASPTMGNEAAGLPLGMPTSRARMAEPDTGDAIPSTHSALGSKNPMALSVMGMMSPTAVDPVIALSSGLIHSTADPDVTVSPPVPRNTYPVVKALSVTPRTTVIHSAVGAGDVSLSWVTTPLSVFPSSASSPPSPHVTLRPPSEASHATHNPDSTALSPVTQDEPIAEATSLAAGYTWKTTAASQSDARGATTWVDTTPSESSVEGAAPSASTSSTHVPISNHAGTSTATTIAATMFPSDTIPPLTSASETSMLTSANTAVPSATMKAIITSSVLSLAGTQKAGGGRQPVPSPAAHTTLAGTAAESWGILGPSPATTLPSSTLLSLHSPAKKPATASSSLLGVSAAGQLADGQTYTELTTGTTPTTSSSHTMRRAASMSAPSFWVSIGSPAWGERTATTAGITTGITTGSTADSTAGSTTTITAGSTTAITTGSTTGSTSGSTTTMTAGSTARSSTTASTAGSAAGSTTGNTTASTARSTMASTAASTMAATAGSTRARTVASTMVATAGSTTASTAASTARSTMAVTAGITTASTAGRTTARTAPSTMAATAGSTTASTEGSAAGNTTASTAASTARSTMAVTAGITTASTAGRTTARTARSSMAATAGSTTASTAASTTASTAGSAAGSTTGNTTASTARSTMASTTGSTAGSTTARTVASTMVATAGSTTASTAGSATGSTTGNTTASTAASTMAATAGNTTASTARSTMAVTAGSTTASTAGSTIVATAGSTTASPVGSNTTSAAGSATGSTAGNTTASTARSTMAVTAGSTTASTAGSIAAVSPTAPASPAKEVATGTMTPDSLWTNASPATTLTPTFGTQRGLATAPITSAYTTTVHRNPFPESPPTRGLIMPAASLYPFGTEEGDQECVQRMVDFNCPLLKPEIGFPFGKSLQDILYFTDNGQIVFPPTENYVPSNPNPPPQGFSGQEALPMVAAFWDDADFSKGVGTTWYQEYSTLSSTQNPFVHDVEGQIEKYLKTPYEAKWTLKVTWEKAPAYPSQWDDTQTNTYQAILTTDGNLSFALLLYQDGGMQWNYTKLAAGNVLIGFSSGDGYAQNNELIHKPPADKYRPDQHSSDGIGLRGLWIYRLDRLSRVNYRLRCLAWLDAEPEPGTWNSQLPPCPCSQSQAELDPRYRRSRGLADTSVRMLRTTSPSPAGAGVRCLYQDGSLLEGWQERAWSLPIHPTTDRELEAFSWCCLHVRKPLFCTRFAEKRPRVGCEGYMPPTPTGAFGDPHITTLDGLTYTFNGLGDFVLLLASDARSSFVLHGRTARTGMAQATNFVAFAAQYISTTTTTVEWTLGSQDDIQVLLNNKTIQFSYSQDMDAEVYYSPGILLVNSSSFMAVFDGAIAVSISATSRILSMVCSLLSQYHNSTKGLLGVWDQDPTDDFQMPNGTSIPVNSSEEEIYSYGMTWAVGEHSLFAQPLDSPEMNFSPTFLSRLRQENESQYQLAALQCHDNKECIYDSLSTGDVALGLATQRLTADFQQKKTTLNAFPPIITGDASLTAFRTERVRRQYHATGEGARFVPHLSPELNISESGILTWEPHGTAPLTINLKAVGSNNLSALLQLRFTLCSCSRSQECDYSNTVTLGQSSLQLAACRCEGGYSGPFCQNLLDPCTQGCFPGVSCSSFSGCGPCPPGLTGDGRHCSDIDECMEGTACPGNATCTNTVGSYICTCPADQEGKGPGCGSACGSQSCPDGYCGNGGRCLLHPITCTPACACPPAFTDQRCLVAGGDFRPLPSSDLPLRSVRLRVRTLQNATAEEFSDTVSTILDSLEVKAFQSNTNVTKTTESDSFTFVVVSEFAYDSRGTVIQFLNEDLPAAITSAFNRQRRQREAGARLLFQHLHLDSITDLVKLTVTELRHYFHCGLYGYKGYQLHYVRTVGFICISPCKTGYCQHGGQCQHLPEGPMCSCLPFSIFSPAGSRCERLGISLGAFLGILLGALALLCLLLAVACLALRLCRRHRCQYWRAKETFWRPRPFSSLTMAGEQEEPIQSHLPERCWEPWLQAIDPSVQIRIQRPHIRSTSQLHQQP